MSSRSAGKPKKGQAPKRPASYDRQVPNPPKDLEYWEANDIIVYGMMALWKGGVFKEREQMLEMCVCYLADANQRLMGQMREAFKEMEPDYQLNLQYEEGQGSK